MTWQNNILSLVQTTLSWKDATGTGHWDHSAPLVFNHKFQLEKKMEKKCYFTRVFFWVSLPYGLNFCLVWNTIAALQRTWHQCPNFNKAAWTKKSWNKTPQSKPNLNKRCVIQKILPIYILFGAVQGNWTDILGKCIAFLPGKDLIS